MFLDRSNWLASIVSKQPKQCHTTTVAEGQLKAAELHEYGHWLPASQFE